MKFWRCETLLLIGVWLMKKCDTACKRFITLSKTNIHARGHSHTNARTYVYIDRHNIMWIQICPSDVSVWTLYIYSLYFCICIIYMFTWIYANNTKLCGFVEAFMRVGSMTQSGRDKMAAILQTEFSNVFHCGKYILFCFKCHWSLIMRINLTINRHRCR